MDNELLFNRLCNVLRSSEIIIVRLIYQEMNGEKEKNINMKELVKRTGKSRSVISQTLRLLEVGGIIESRNLGVSGTYVNITNIQMLEQLIKIEK